MIETVLGPVRAESLGMTCMHDHLRSDASRLHREGAFPPPPLDEVGLENVGYLRWNMLASADNLRLDDDDLMGRELARAAVRGQSAVVECTSVGLGPVHASLPAISRASGVAVISAYGFYVPYCLPAWVDELDESGLEAHLYGALVDAIPGTEFRAGLLGIMGTTRDFGRREREILRAASRAGLRAGASVSVRLDPDARNGLSILELIVGEGLPAERVVLTNADEYMDAQYWRDLSDAGAVLEMCFGTEAVHVGRVDNPSDRERLAFFERYSARHPSSRHVLGLSTWTKAQLHANGGYGYDYLLARIVPELAERGFAPERLEMMLSGEPRRLLSRVQRDADPAHAVPEATQIERGSA